MEEQKAQLDNRFLKGRQTAYMIYDNFKISGTGEALRVFKDLSGRARLRHTNWIICSGQLFSIERK